MKEHSVTETQPKGVMRELKEEEEERNCYYTIVKTTRTVLERQLQQAHIDIEALSLLKHRALLDPLAFIQGAILSKVSFFLSFFLSLFSSQLISCG
jgi:hypothetical protein